MYRYLCIDQHQEETNTNLVELFWDLDDYEEYEKSRANKALIKFFFYFLSFIGV